MAFSQIFDVPRLETLLRHPIQEWKNLKVAAEQASPLKSPVNPEFTEDKVRAAALRTVHREKIACWSLWAAQMPDPGKPAGSGVQNHLGLDIDHWQAPLHYSHPPQEWVVEHAVEIVEVS